LCVSADRAVNPVAQTCAKTGPPALQRPGLSETPRWSKGDSNSPSHPERQRSDGPTWVPRTAPVCWSASCSVTERCGWRPQEDPRASWRQRAMTGSFNASLSTVDRFLAPPGRPSDCQTGPFGNACGAAADHSRFRSRDFSQGGISPNPAASPSKSSTTSATR
jgi:hypothetical protein